MFSDFIDYVGRGYQLIWNERFYFLKLSLIPFIVRALTHGIAHITAIDENPIRLAILMLPSFFVQGWLVAQVVRLIFFQERWPIHLTGNAKHDAAIISGRTRCVLGGMILFALIQFIMAGIAGYAAALQSGIEAQGSPAQSSSPYMLFAGIIMILAVLWAFRLVWLYMPVMIDMRMKRFLSYFSGIKGGAELILLYVLAMVPTLMVFGVVLGVFGGFFPSESSAFEGVQIFFQICAELIIALIAVAIISFALLHRAGAKPFQK